MILKASQRGGAKQLGLHLMNGHDNEHVEVHEIHGFLSEDVVGALRESYAVSRGTKCEHHLRSSIGLRSHRIGFDGLPFFVPPNGKGLLMQPRPLAKSGCASRAKLTLIVRAHKPSGAEPRSGAIWIEAREGLVRINPKGILRNSKLTSRL